jgi:hypothetical protein
MAAAPSLACERHSIRGSMHNRGKNFPKLPCSTLGSCNPWPLANRIYEPRSGYQIIDE